MKKRVISAGLAVIICLAVSAPARALDIAAETAVVMEAETGAILYEKNPDQKMLLASTTKILTALVVLEKCALDEEVEIRREYTAVEGSSIYLKPGETVTVENLLYGLILESGNDAAVALACHTAGSTEAFAELMNEKAAELGAVNSGFQNPHGLDAEGHFSTARDLALILAAAMENEAFSKISGTKSITFGDRYYANHNKLLWQCDGVIGGKTGYTKSAGRTLATCAERDGMRLICVTMNDKNDWADHAALYDWAYGAYTLVNVCAEREIWGEVPVISGIYGSAEVVTEEAFSCLIEKGKELDVHVELPRFVYAGVSGGSTAGAITISLDGRPIKTVRLLYADAIPLDESNKLEKWEIWLRRILAIC